MSDQTAITAADLYARIVDGVRTDHAMEAALLADFNGTVATRFGVTLPASGRLSRSETGFLLSYGGQDFQLGDPRTAKPGELNDAELELVAGGGDAPCPTGQPHGDNSNRTAESAMRINRI